MTHIITRYKEALAKEELQADEYQARAIAILQKCQTQLSKPPSLWNKWHMLRRKQGVYLWGDVGRGKTLLMNMFYASLETTQKQRWHFQEFMQYIHEQLKHWQGEPNPLNHIVAKLADELTVLCLDELLIEDIADALLLAGLLPALLARNILFVTTSNSAPADLYKNGWQRERFLPTIDYLQKHLAIVHLNNPHDYRQLSPLPTAAEKTYYVYPDDQAAADFLQKAFAHFATGPIEEGFTLDVNGHPLVTWKCSADTLGCDFTELCVKPRNSHDYLKLCAKFSTIVLSHVPQFTESSENAARRFMSLIDVCYDRHTRLILSAAVPLPGLYQGRLLQTPFKRTTSRLWEMQQP